jgi:hypothetical protein
MPDYLNTSPTVEPLTRPLLSLVQQGVNMLTCGRKFLPGDSRMTTKIYAKLHLEVRQECTSNGLIGIY